MKRLAFLPLLLVLATPAVAKPPVVVELFTAQGCSSCGKVDAAVDKLADDPGLIVLTWSVDYWDYLGWKDTFAKPEFTDRQRAYDKRFGLRDVYTPQVIVDGNAQASGATAGQVEALIREARRSPSDPPDMAFVGADRIAVGSGPRPRGGGEVWLVRYDPRTQQVDVKDGDNRGQTVAERNVVREVERLGRWEGRPVALKFSPASEEGLTTLIIVQGADGGRIIGALLEGDQKAAKP
jgi:hypothetical protein